MRLKRGIPRLLIAETTFYVLQTDVKVLAVEQVVRAFDDARLEQGKIGNRLFVGIDDVPDIAGNDV